jgi:hypothetical protein
LRANGWNSQPAGEFVGILEDATSTAPLILLQVLTADRNHQRYAVGIIGCVLPFHDVFRTPEQLVDRERLARRRSIREEELVKLIESLGSLNLA